MPVPSFIRAMFQRCSRCIPGIASSCLLKSGPRAIARAAVLVVFMGAIAVSCSDRDRRMGEREALDFRRNIVRKNYGGLSPDQRWRVMYHPARTRREIRSTLDSYLKDTARRRRAEAAAGSGQTGSGNVSRPNSGPNSGPLEEGKSSAGESGQEIPGTGEAEASPSTDDSSPDNKAGDS